MTDLQILERLKAKLRKHDQRYEIEVSDQEFAVLDKCGEALAAWEALERMLENTLEGEVILHVDGPGMFVWSAARSAAESAALAEVVKLRLDLADAGMSVRRLLRKLSKHAPDDPIIAQMNDWLKRKNLQGSVLR